MKKMTAYMAMVLMSIACTFAEVTWRSLWDGTSDPSMGADKFSGWHIMGTHDEWHLDDSSIHNGPGQLGTEALWLKEVMTQGTFEVTYKITAGNGGVFIIGRPDGTTEDDVDELGSDFDKGTPGLLGMEVDIGGVHAGCIYCVGCGGWLVHSEGEQAYSALSDASDWVDLRMSAKGREFKTWVRQHGTVEWVESVTYTNDSEVKGRFGFEMHSGAQIWYKNMQIAGGCSDAASPYYDAEAVEGLGWALEDNGSCDVNNRGCKDPGYTEYKPDALFEDSTLCLTVNTVRADKRFAYHLDNQDNLMLSLGDIGRYYIRVVDIKGALKISEQGEGRGEQRYHLEPGIHILKVTANDKDLLVEKVFIPQ